MNTAPPSQLAREVDELNAELNAIDRDLDGLMLKVAAKRQDAADREGIAATQDLLQ